MYWQSHGDFWIGHHHFDVEALHGQSRCCNVNGHSTCLAGQYTCNSHGILLVWCYLHRYQFQFDGKLPLGCHQGDPNTILLHTYNALYVRDSSFLLSTCMINIKMKNDWKWQCVHLILGIFWSHDLLSMHLAWVPMWLCLPDDRQAVLMIDRALRPCSFCLSFNLSSRLHPSTKQKQASRYSAHGF